MPGSFFVVHSRGPEASLDRQVCGHESAANILVLQPHLVYQNFESLFNTVLGQDSFIFDEVGWWSGFKKGGNRIYDVDIGLFDIL